MRQHNKQPVEIQNRSGSLKNSWSIWEGELFTHLRTQSGENQRETPPGTKEVEGVIQQKHGATCRNQNLLLNLLTLSPTLSPLSRSKLPSYSCLSPRAVGPFPQTTHADFTNTSALHLLILVLLVLAVVAGSMEPQV